MVIYEAARALVNLKNLKSRDLCPAISGKQQKRNKAVPLVSFRLYPFCIVLHLPSSYILYNYYFSTVLQLFLSSPRPTLRFAAVRTLNKVAMTQPMSVTTCNLDLENLITDVNRSIATLAITTLLKVSWKITLL